MHAASSLLFRHFRIFFTFKMPGQCEAVGCSNHTMMKTNKPSFYRFPKDPERRNEWANALRKLNRNGTKWTPSSTARICGDHFINGKPNHTDPAHPDYIPSVFRHKQNGNAGRKMERYNSAAKRRQMSAPPSVIDQASDTVCTKATEFPCEKPDSSAPPPMDDGPSSTSTLPVADYTKPVSEIERSMLYQEIDALRAERDAALEQLKVTEDKLRKASLTAGSVKDNDTRCKQNTGLSWIVFLTTFNFLEAFVSKKKHKTMALIDQFFITLLKLRTGVPFDFIACHTNVSTTCLIEIFWKWIDTMYTNLSFLVRSPDPGAVRHTLSPVFRKCYPRLTYIVDCFEISMDQPKKLKARDQTYINYKKYDTVKIFIGCTPLGAISFISTAWGGRVSDLELVRNSGFINHNLHTLGDQILADYEFTLQEDFATQLGVEFITPASTKSKKHPSAEEVEVSHKLASVQIHIERITGVLQNQYIILQGPLPITLIKDESMDMKGSRADKIVHVCAYLVNLGDGIV